MLDISELFIASTPKGFTWDAVNEWWASGEVEPGMVYIDLLNHFKLGGWKPKSISYKDGGIMQSSPIGDRARLVMRNYDNQTETFTLIVRAGHQKGAIHDLRRLRNVLERAADYQTGWSSTVVYVAARAIGESNLRYALVVRGLVPEDPDPYAPPFVRDADGRSLGMIELMLEHWPWQETIPGNEGVDLGVLGYEQARMTGFTSNLGTVLASGTLDDQIDGRAFFGNKADFASITHMFFTRVAAPGYSPNIIANPFVATTLFEAGGPSVGDCVYFGSDTGEANGGAFTNALMYIAIAGAGFTVTWEFWNGAWVALSPFDDTVGFTKNGFRGVFFAQPSNWATVANPLDGTVGYWIRARVTAAPGVITRPAVTHHNPYTVLWPNILIREIDRINGGKQLAGDLPILAKLRVIQRYNTKKLCKVIVGLRSEQRGPDFRAYINLKEGGLHNRGILVEFTGASLSDVANPAAPAMSHTLFSSAVAATGTITVNLNQSFNLPPQYRGTFRAYTRVNQTLGSAGDITIQVRTRHQDGPWTAGDLVAPVSLDDWQLIDLGKIDIMTNLKEDENIRTDFQIELVLAANAAAVADSATLALYDLILLPIDEWAGEFYDETGLLYMDGQTASGTILHDILEIDGITNPKLEARAVIDEMIETTATALPITPTPLGRKGEWVGITNHYPILQVGRDQRLWFIQVECDSGVWHAYPWLTCNLQAFRSQRYSSMRGVE